MRMMLVVLFLHVSTGTIQLAVDKSAGGPDIGQEIAKFQR